MAGKEVQKEKSKMKDVKSKSADGKSADRGKQETRAQNVNKATGGEDEDEETSHCGICNIVVTNDDQAVCCEVCDVWHHIKCEDLPVDFYEYMLKVGGQIAWNCKKCKHGCVKIYSRVRKLEKQNSEMLAKQLELENKVEITNVTVTSQMEELKQQIQSLKETTGQIKEEYMKGDIGPTVL